ncbi:MAG TPA: tetratricopeptide repeat protein [Gemmatimonadaceae bacterium]|jgi:tetratricopeptide (TPR) repeat protein|nr:tetratricopeptide repeat protein [Gemmatimonadaceae bacterium]
MPNQFLSSEEYDERAHQLYNEGEYDQALTVLREGITLYPNAVELHIGVGYAHHAREEYAWARRAFEDALVLDPEHEDALAGLAETLLKFGQREAALRTFHRTLELGYADDLDLMLQIGRALFREGMIEESKEFFEVGVTNAPDNPEAVSCVGYAEHRLGQDDQAILTLRKALKIDPDHVEARIYLGNILYDRGDYEASLYHLDKSNPDDHWDELGVWRLIELKKSIYKLVEGDPELKPWEDRVRELTSESDDIDEMLAEIEAQAMEAGERENRGQLELFGALLTSLVDAQGNETTESAPAGLVNTTEHRIITGERTYEGTWEEIVHQMRDHKAADVPIEQYMATEARRGYGLTGVEIPWQDAESFIRGSATAGLLRIDR